MEKVVGTTTISDGHSLNLVWRGPKAAPDCFHFNRSAVMRSPISCGSLLSQIVRSHRRRAGFLDHPITRFSLNPTLRKERERWPRGPPWSSVPFVVHVFYSGDFGDSP